MKIYIARPTRDRPYYFMSEHPLYKAEEVEIEDKLVNDISETMVKFHHYQAALADMYHKIDKELYPI